MTKNFAADRIRLGLAELFSGSATPTSGGGVSAQIGSLYLQNTGAVGSAWLKTGAGATSWTQLQQSFNWYVVTNFGAVGDGVTDDRAAIAACIAACIAGGGGVVYFPQATYACSKDGANPYSFDLNGSTDIQFLGAGFNSVVKQVGSAGTNPWSLFRLRGGCQRIRFSSLTLDGSGLTNPSASADSHLINVVGALTTLQCFGMRFTGTVTGDGLHCVGTAGNLVTRVMTTGCEFVSCSRYGVLYGEGVQYAWIVSNFATGCDTEYAVIGAANVNIDSIVIIGNEAVHTDASVSQAIIISGDATGLATKICCAQNVVINGFMQLDNCQFSVFSGNVLTSGTYAIATAVLAMTGMADCTINTNLIDRASTADAGPAISVDTSADLVVRSNLLVNEVTGAANKVHFIYVKNTTSTIVGANLCRAMNMGASVTYGIVLEAVTTACDDNLFQGNQITGAAGSLLAGLRLLVNGANIGDTNANGNQMTQIDYGLATEDGGAGSFNGTQYMWAGNNVEAGTGDILQTATAIVFHIGWNAGTFGPTLVKGTGSPEGAVTARIGSMYMKEDAPGAIFYKESGVGNTGWILVGGGMLVFGIGDAGTAATALYLLPGFSTATAGATEIQLVVTRPGTLRNLRVHITGAGTDNQTVTFTVRKNGADTAITCTKANDTSGDTSDLVNSTTVVAGDLVSISILKAAGVTAGQTNVLASVELV
jgi:hypothetical protein